VCVVASHTGAAPPQSPLLMHATHTPVDISQSGVPPVHRVRFVAEHCVHAPVAKHAGVAPPHSASPPQARQACVVVLQTGAVPPHCAFETQGTHVPVGV
jgi:hypothetical protein